MLHSPYQATLAALYVADLETRQPERHPGSYQLVTMPVSTCLHTSLSSRYEQSAPSKRVSILA